MSLLPVDHDNHQHIERFDNSFSCCEVQAVSMACKLGRSQVTSDTSNIKPKSILSNSHNCNNKTSSKSTSKFPTTENSLDEKQLNEKSITDIDPMDEFITFRDFSLPTSRYNSRKKEISFHNRPQGPAYLSKNFGLERSEGKSVAIADRELANSPPRDYMHTYFPSPLSNDSKNLIRRGPDTSI